MNSRDLSISTSPCTSVLGLQVHFTMPGVLCGCWGSDSGLHTCTASTVLTEPSPQALLTLILVYFIRFSQFSKMSDAAKTTGPSKS